MKRSPRKKIPFRETREQRVRPRVTAIRTVSPRISPKEIRGVLINRLLRGATLPTVLANVVSGKERIALNRAYRLIDAARRGALTITINRGSERIVFQIDPSVVKAPNLADKKERGIFRTVLLHANPSDVTRELNARSVRIKVEGKKRRWQNEVW